MEYVYIYLLLLKQNKCYVAVIDTPRTKMIFEVLACTKLYAYYLILFGGLTCTVDVTCLCCSLLGGFEAGIRSASA